MFGEQVYKRGEQDATLPVKAVERMEAVRQVPDFNTAVVGCFLHYFFHYFG
jgi:hypothetical protein